MCVNESISTGAMFEFLKEAQVLDMGVAILNPNQNDFYHIPIRGNSNPAEHTLYVNDYILCNCKATDIIMVAHGTAGEVVIRLVNEREKLHPRIRAIAFIDVEHDIKSANPGTKDLIQKVGRSWLKSNHPLDTTIFDKVAKAGCACFSSGHIRAEMAVTSATPSVLNFIRGAIKSVLGTRKVEEEREKLEEQERIKLKKREYEEFKDKLVAKREGAPSNISHDELIDLCFEVHWQCLREFKISADTQKVAGIIKANDSEEANTCKICYDEVINVTLAPCGHRCMCQHCGEDMKNSGRRLCPICRANITNFIITFDA